MLSKCGSCGGTIWELSEEEPRNSKYKMWFVRCFACKVPIEATDYIYVPNQVDELQRRLKSLEDSTNRYLGTIDENVRRLFDLIRRSLK